MHTLIYGDTIILQWSVSDPKFAVKKNYGATKETKEITESSDIYGFGLILIELLTGKTPVDAEIGLHENVVEWARYCYSDCHLEAWVDPLIKVHALKNPNHIVEIMYLALQCTAHDIAARPYAEDVVKRLESIMRSSTLCF
ncbi:putative transferase, protein kinase RLK-Pelle-Singleton family [Helianthus annuus]|nr:putative transferase, protein kinase RLK-Pelle-Singleton family [Helianthus annuus]